MTLPLTSRASVTSGATVRSRVDGVSRSAIFCSLPSSRTRICAGFTSRT